MLIIIEFYLNYEHNIMFSFPLEHETLRTLGTQEKSVSNCEW